MTILNTCRGRNSAGTRIIAQPSAQELVGDTFVPSSARRRENQPIELLVDGIADGVSGFAVHLRDWVRHLVRYGVKVSIPSHRNSEYPEIVKLHDTKVEHPIKLYFLPGGGFPPKNPGEYTVGYTVFETNEFPEYFRDNAENVDLLWTANPFNYDRYVQVGIPREKIEIFPEGVDTELFNQMVSPLLKKNDNAFYFGSVIGWSARKGIHILLKAYLEEFERSENTTLFVSGGWYAMGHAESELESVKKEIKNKDAFPEVILDWTDRSDWEMPALFNSFDCFCLPSLGEGYGRPLAEAAACELPVITTNHGPMNEIITESTGYLIDVEKIAPCPECDWICDWYKNADFAHPSKKHLRELMRTVYEDYDTAKSKAKKAREFIKANHNTATIIEKVVEKLGIIRER